jgi:hypothetical protein
VASALYPSTAIKHGLYWDRSWFLDVLNVFLFFLNLFGGEAE